MSRGDTLNRRPVQLLRPVIDSFSVDSSDDLRSIAAVSIETLSEWLEAEGIVSVAGPSAIADTEAVRSILIAAAREGRAVSYSELLGLLGHRFTRPKMRAVCKTLDAIDLAGKHRGEPSLAVLVVRESDRLPGQGWWIGVAETYGYNGEWTGREAMALVDSLQAAVIGHWRR